MLQELCYDTLSIYKELIVTNLCDILACVWLLSLIEDFVMFLLTGNVIEESESSSNSGESNDSFWTSKSSTISIVAVLEKEPHSSQAFPIPHVLNQSDPNDLVKRFGTNQKNQSFLLLD